MASWNGTAIGRFSICRRSPQLNRRDLVAAEAVCRCGPVHRTGSVLGHPGARSAVPATSSRLPWRLRLEESQNGARRDPLQGEIPDPYGNCRSCGRAAAPTSLGSAALPQFPQSGFLT